MGQRMTKAGFAIACVLAMVTAAPVVAAQPAQPAQQVQPAPLPEPMAVEIEVPAFDGLPAVTMAGELYLPAGAGPFPVVIYSHGRASKPAERSALKYPIPRGHAGYWMRKGFAVVAPVRPGYGATGGPDRERSGTRLEKDGSCGGAVRLAAATEASTTAVRAAIDWARAQTWADRERILLVGQSVGGLATVATAAKTPPGVVGFVNFAGGAAGFPKERPGASCGEAALTELYRRAGRGVRVPNIWLYAENDRFWGAEAPRAWHAAFATGGSPTRFVMTAPVPGEDGHRLMLRGGRLWAEHVDPFVAGLGVVKSAVPTVAPTPSPAPTPANRTLPFPTPRFSSPEPASPGK